MKFCNVTAETADVSHVSIVEFRANKRLIISLPPGRDVQKRNAPIIDFVEETRMTVPRHRLNRRTIRPINNIESGCGRIFVRFTEARSLSGMEVRHRRVSASFEVTLLLD